MATDKVEVVVDELSEESLDAWYEDDVEDLSAVDSALTDEDSSPPSADAGDTPDATEVQTTDGDGTPLEDGNSAEPAAPVPADPYAWIQDLDPEMRKQAEALQHRELSNSGRVAALQSRLDEQQARLDSQNAVAGNRRQIAVEASVEEEEADEGLKDFREQFPSVAENLDKMFDKRMAKERAEMQEQVRPLQEQQAQARISQQQATLRSKAAEIFNTAETGIQLEDVTASEAWKTWLNGQPEGYRNFAVTARNAEDAGVVLQQFADWADDQIYANQERHKLENPEEYASEADRLDAQRQKTLKGATPGSKSATIDDGSLGDYEAFFDQAVGSD